MTIFNFSNTKVSDKFVYGVVKSIVLTLLAETIAKESITCNELLTPKYGLKLEKF
jgi:hypothetical protein